VGRGGVFGAGGGSWRGEKTILCVIRTSDDAVHIMKKLRKIVEQ